MGQQCPSSTQGWFFGIAHNFSFTEDHHYSVPFSFVWWLNYNASSKPCAIQKDSDNFIGVYLIKSYSK